MHRTNRKLIWEYLLSRVAQARAHHLKERSTEGIGCQKLLAGINPGEKVVLGYSSLLPLPGYWQLMERSQADTGAVTASSNLGEACQ